MALLPGRAGWEVTRTDVQRAGIGAERIEAGIDRRGDDAARALGRGGSSRCLLIRRDVGWSSISRRIIPRHAAAGLVLIERVALHHRVERPANLAGLRLERLDDVVRRAEMERAVHFDRRCFERVFGGVSIGLAQIAGMVFSGNLQPLDVVDIDILQGRWPRLVPPYAAQSSAG
ncbi:hypothetical protein [Rhizobium sp. P28RR-XV]|uniref:hypothetical protein n=1 Tax=Rhizobium sp. P28RR-XV TaxID=2726737 RepID=UPI001456C4AA|nr:hypothetical protein [Rhizobium sp. P28RR-XV]NLR88208.1 hypothetical protein [Rhizobium sp. P28RR-XV]